jgi:integrase
VPVKAASAAIAFYQKINLFSHEPTQSPAVCLVREAAIRRFGLNPKNRKDPFEWAHVVKFAEAYGSRQKGYCHLVVATMAVVMFGGMCRYDDASGLMWSNIRFEEDGSAFEITFDKRKNAQYRQGNKVLVTALPNAAICPVRMLQRLRAYTGGAEGLYVFRGFNGRLVAKSSGSTIPGPTKITYDQFLRYLSQWFSSVMGVSVKAFRKQFATQSGRSGGASAAANSDVPKELWGQHGDWSSWEAQKRYMKSDKKHLLSVSQAAMSLPKGTEPDMRIEDDPASSPPQQADDDDSPPEVVGVPEGVFVWS